MRKTTFLLLMALGFIACKADIPVAPLAQRPLSLNIAPGLVLNGTDTVSSAMFCMSLVFENPGGGSSSWTTYSTNAIFLDTNGAILKPGDILLNGISIPYSTGAWYHSESQQAFGTTHHWSVSANQAGTIPSIDTSVDAPNLFHVNYPRVSDTVSKSAGFTCTYGSPGTDSVFIIIEYDSLATVHLFDSSIHHVEPDPVCTISANTGSFYVSGSLLSSMPTSGLIDVWIIGCRYKVLNISGRKYLVAAVSRARSFCNIKN